MQQEPSAVIPNISTISNNLSNEIRERAFNILRRQVGPLPEEQLQQLYNNLQQSFTIEQFEDIIADQVGKRKAPSIAKQLFDCMEKGNIHWKDQIRRQLTQLKISDTKIEEIIVLADSGNKVMFSYEIYNSLKQNEKQFIQKYSKHILEISNVPLDKTKFIKIQKDLQLYRYPQETISEGERNTAKTIMVVGKTGQGKSTLLNSMTNYLNGTQINDPFRYQIVVENVINYGQSVTDKITEYFVKDRSTPENIYRFIDTPGLLDTRNKQTHLEKDKENIEYLKKLLKNEVKQIHCVLFVINFTTNRIDRQQKYMFECIMEIFGKDILQSLVFVFTHSNFQQPKVVEIVKNKQIGFGNYWPQIPEPKYIQVDNLYLEKKVDTYTIDQKTLFDSWKLTMKNIKDLFEKITILPGNNLVLTKQAFKEKQHLIRRIQNFKKLLNHQIQLQIELEQEVQFLASAKDYINKNNVQYQHCIYKQLTQPHKVPVLKCKHCIIQNCHINCSRQPTTLKNCSVMDENGNCTWCQDKCPAKDHFVSNQIRVRKKMKLKESIKALKTRFNLAGDQTKVAQKIIQNLITAMHTALSSIYYYADKITIIENRLNQICLTMGKKETAMEYLECQISKSLNQRKNFKKEQQFKLYLSTINQQSSIEHHLAYELLLGGQKAIKFYNDCKQKLKNRKEYQILWCKLKSLFQK